MVILGIDPGYAIVGYGVIEAKNSRYCSCRGLSYPHVSMLMSKENQGVIRAQRLSEKFTEGCG